LASLVERGRGDAVVASMASTAAPIVLLPDEGAGSEDERTLVLIITGSVLCIVLVVSIGYVYFSTPRRRSRVYHHDDDTYIGGAERTPELNNSTVTANRQYGDMEPKKNTRKPSVPFSSPQLNADPNAYAFPQESPASDPAERDEMGTSARGNSIRRAPRFASPEEENAQAAEQPRRTILRKPNNDAIPIPPALNPASGGPEATTTPVTTNQTLTELVPPLPGELFTPDGRSLRPADSKGDTRKHTPTPTSPPPLTAPPAAQPADPSAAPPTAPPAAPSAAPGDGEVLRTLGPAEKDAEGRLGVMLWAEDLMVAEVTPGSGADLAGVREGMRVVAVQGHQTPDHPSYCEAVKAVSGGVSLTLAMPAPPQSLLLLRAAASCTGQLTPALQLTADAAGIRPPSGSHSGLLQSVFEAFAPSLDTDVPLPVAETVLRVVGLPDGSRYLPRNASGYDFREISAASQAIQRQEALEAFRVFDPNCTGRISVSRLRRVLAAAPSTAATAEHTVGALLQRAKDAGAIVDSECIDYCRLVRQH